MHPSLALVSGLLVLIGVLFLPDYRLLGGLPLAYLMLWLGARLPVRIGSRNDISYGVYIYGCPVQQALIMWGFASLGWFGFAVLGLAATIPIAALSWWLVERPSLRLKNHSVGGEITAAVAPTTALIFGLMFIAYYVLGTFRA
jgi:peptidoglycan/LPS O-acetylase OafA/YrhL